MSSPLSVERLLSQSFNSQDGSQYKGSEDKDEKLLLDEAEQIYNNILNVIANHCINESPSQILKVPNTPDGLSPVDDSSKTFDSGDLSQVNLVYNNVTFQVYPGPKITNERGRGDESGGSKTQDKSITNAIECKSCFDMQ